MAISLNQKAAAPRRAAAGPWTAGLASAVAGYLAGFRRPVKPAEMIFFNSQLSLMLEVGTSLTGAMQAIASQTANPAFREVLQALLADIREGRQLSEAMRRHPRVFEGVYVSMVKAGETGGFLKGILDRVVEMQERRQSLRSQIRATLTYPAVLSALGLVVVIFILTWVLPRFLGLFEGKEHILPWTTRLMILLSESLRGYWWAYLLGLLALVLGLRAGLATPYGRRLLDGVLMNAPGFGRLTNKISTCDLLRTMGHLMESRVPILESLQVTRETIRNSYYREFVDRIHEHVEQGGRFAQPFASQPHLLESVKQMVAAGEEAGNLSGVMLRLAAFYDTEVDRELKSLASLIEPVALIFLGAVVGLIVSSVILPLFKIAHTVH